MEKYVKDYIGNKRTSYHQINIFVKLFISQYIVNLKHNYNCLV